MTKAVWGGRAAAVLAAAMLATSCGDMTREGTSPAYLTMTTLEGSPVVNGSFGTTLASDVLNVDAAGKQSIAADNGRATFALQLRDPGTTSAPNSPTANNAITLTQYHVEYIRADGHNVQGIDVPYAFDGGLNLTITGSGTASFLLVRIQAKQEAPLKALALSGGQNTISTIARVTFYGHDQTGREVSVSGNIDVIFSDWVG